MIDTNKLTEHTAMLKGALDEHATQAAGHLRTLSGFAAGFLGNDADQQLSETRCIAAELGLYAAKLAAVSRRLTLMVDAPDAPAADDEPTASGGMPKADAFKSAAKDGVVATDAGLVRSPTQMPSYAGRNTPATRGDLKTLLGRIK